jgi:hypothetical protein
VVERFRDVVFLVLDLRAVGALRLVAAFVAPDVVDFRRVVFRRVPELADADFRVDADFARVDFRAVDFAVVDLRAVDFARVDFRVEADFFAEDDFLRGVAFAADDFAPDVVLAALARRVDVVFLRRGDFADPRSVSRFVRPARADVAFSSCATPLATSSCASETALSTGLSPDRFERLFFLAAICVSPVR